MSLTPQDFVSKWKRVTAREKQTYQEHFLDLCQLAGHPTPNDYDPTGTTFGFEMGVAKTSGGQGWADVAKYGFFGWEYKGKDADLDKAYEQLLRYRDALKNPPLLIVSDINNIIIRTNYTNLATRTIALSLDDLLTADGLRTLKTVFFNPEQLKPQETIESVTQAAAQQFSTLANVLRKFGEEPQAVAHFLIRLLFCLFAEDIGLLPEKLFPRLLQQTNRNSKHFAQVLQQLFRAMNTGGFFGVEKILHFNGGLFDDDTVLQLDSDAMDIIGKIDGLDWGAIKPSIFGTLFERGLDPGKRSQLGAHYTGEDDILLIVEPVLMAPLRKEWAGVKEEVRKLKEEEGKEAKGKKKTALQKKIRDLLLAFADKIAAVKVLDPACGSANFLYVALRLLLDLQNEVLSFSDEMGAGRPYITVTPAQLYGIETNEYAHELAQMTIQIGYIQWLRDNGYGLPSEPILKQTKNIMNMDAILGYEPRPDRSHETSEPVEVRVRASRATDSDARGDLSGLAREPAWPTVDVIIGNPPFLGGSKLRQELGDDYVKKLWSLYGDKIPNSSDLVCYWFEKARAMIESGKAKRAGLLSTQSLRMKGSRQVLERIKQTGNIFWAQSDREWILDGAAVRVSMVGFDNGTEKTSELDGKPVTAINTDLTASLDLTQKKRLSENRSLCFQGPSPKGPFDISFSLANSMLKAPLNPNGRPNSDVVRPVANAADLVQSARNEWTIDFFPMGMEQASMYEMPFEYVKKHVYPIRANNRRAARAEKWWLYGEASHAMRNSLANKTRYIATPRVAKHRIFVWQEAKVLSNDRTFVIARDDEYFFGVLHSRLHEVWSLATSSRHGDGSDGGRPTYNNTTCFETFPFPWAPGAEPVNDPRVQAIAQAAKELVEQRDRWLNATPTPEGPPNTTTQTLNADLKSTSSDLGEVPEGRRGSGSKRTLTNLYNARPTWLDLAHKRLDTAVFAAYGWQNDLSDEEILEKLLALNLERSK